jgi:hypothetical protein
MTITTRDTAKLLALRDRMSKLTPGDRLRLCAELLDQGGEGNLAIVETLGGGVIDALRAKRMFPKPTPTLPPSPPGQDEPR